MMKLAILILALVIVSAVAVWLQLRILALQAEIAEAQGALRVLVARAESAFDDGARLGYAAVWAYIDHGNLCPGVEEVVEEAQRRRSEKGKVSE